MMEACMRCGGTDLDGADASVRCARCGYEGPAAQLHDSRALAEFQAARAALFKGAQVVRREEERPKRWLSRGVAAIVGFVFVFGGAMAFFAAAAGGPNVLPLLATGITGLLFGAPFIALARR
jgi:hypothetical protein